MSEKIDIQIVNEQPTLSFKDSSVVLSLEDSSSPSLAFTDSSVNLSIGSSIAPSLALNGGATSINLNVGNSNNEVQLVATGTPGAKGADGSGGGVELGTTDTTALAGNTTTISTAQANAIDANTAKETNVSTNLSSTTHASQITINSSDGNNVVIAEASDSIAGVMTVAHHDKLEGIEVSADVTDATNVTAAGALMDSELTDLAGVKGVTISTLQVKPSEGAFANGDKTRLDGMEDNATADQTQADINSLNITAASCSGNAATATNLTAGNKTIDGIVTSKGLIVDDNRSVNAGSDGVAVHIDSMDITDNSTSASGTATTYNHISIENPRLFATNASVTTTNASTVMIKGAPFASSNQTFTNAWAFYIANGAAYFGGAITANGGVTGNVTGNASGSSGTCTGNAATATSLETARNIGGVSFNGTSSINLPGVNTSGNQNTSGNAATATTAQGITGAAEADVTITSDGEVTVKLDSDNNESNQKFKITNNADSVVFSVQEDGIVNMAGGTINIDGSNSNFELNSGSDIILEADNAGGGLASSIQYNSSTGNKIMLGATSDVVVLCNRTSNGTVQIRANTSTAGSGGEVTVATFTDTEVTFSKPLVGNRKFTRTDTSTHFETQGDILYFGSGSTTQGDLCYLKEDGSWGQADADGAATGDDADRDAMGMLAIALGTDPDVDGMLIKGIITMDSDMGDVGNPIYVKTTAGGISASAPTASGDFVRVIGYCLDDTHGVIYFNPDNTWVEID